jgi:hypothetical protein
VSGAGGDIPGAVFDPAERHFAQLTGFLSGPEAAGMEHQELEEHLLASLRETGRRLYQGPSGAAGRAGGAAAGGDRQR